MVSNYSIKPCIHDSALSHRFGAKAASRALADTATSASVIVTMSDGPQAAQDALLGCGIMGGAAGLATRHEAKSAPHATRGVGRAAQPTEVSAEADGAAA